MQSVNGIPDANQDTPILLQIPDYKAKNHEHFCFKPVFSFNCRNLCTKLRINAIATHYASGFFFVDSAFV